MKSALNPYLSFGGNAREALEFYRSVFGGKVEVHTYEEFHAAQDPAEKDNVMHGMIDAGYGITFMAADSPKSIPLKLGNNVSMTLSGDNEKQLTGWYDKLSAGGTVREPLAKAPWGDKFGMFADKFGVEWMVNIGAKQP